MSVRLRLRRTGTRNKACYRVVAADQRSPRDGRFIEALGLYDPRHEDENLDLARVDYWLANGAQPSETVRDIIRRCRDPRCRHCHRASSRAPSLKLKQLQLLKKKQLRSRPLKKPHQQKLLLLKKLALRTKRSAPDDRFFPQAFRQG